MRCALNLVVLIFLAMGVLVFPVAAIFQRADGSLLVHGHFIEPGIVRTTMSVMGLVSVVINLIFLLWQNAKNKKSALKSRPPKS